MGNPNTTEPRTRPRPCAHLIRQCSSNRRTSRWQTDNRKNRLALFLMVGLIVLAGIGPGARDASAQALEACPLPEGLAALPDPAVTAQDVEDGSATLEQFAEAAVSQFKRGGSEVATPQQLAYSGCRPQAGRRPVALRIDVHRDADTGRAGVSACQEHVPFGAQAAIPYLRRDPSGTRHSWADSVGPGLRGPRHSGKRPGGAGRIPQK